MLPGDDVLTATVVNATSYGCRLTNNVTGPDDVHASINLWAGIAPVRQRVLRRLIC